MVLGYAGRLFRWATGVPVPFVGADANELTDGADHDGVVLQETVDVSKQLEDPSPTAVEQAIITLAAMTFAREITQREQSPLRGGAIEIKQELTEIPQDDLGFQLNKQLIIDKLQIAITVFMDQLNSDEQYTVVAVDTRGSERIIVIHLNPPEDDS